MGALAKTTRVLVTHKLELLPRADHVVVMKEGRAVFEGTYGGGHCSTVARRGALMISARCTYDLGEVHLCRRALFP